MMIDFRHKVILYNYMINSIIKQVFYVYQRANFLLFFFDVRFQIKILADVIYFLILTFLFNI